MKYIYEDRILSMIFENPMSKFHVRQIGREAKLDTKTVMSYLKKFTKEDIVVKRKEKHRHTYYEANRLSQLYRYKKSSVMIEKIIKSGLVDYLGEKINPDLIVLFGSMQKGTYHEESDIDLFIKADEKKIDLSRFESKLGHKISLFFEKETNNLSKGLLQNIYNGYVLKGTIEV